MCQLAKHDIKNSTRDNQNNNAGGAIVAAAARTVPQATFSASFTDVLELQPARRAKSFSLLDDQAKVNIKRVSFVVVVVVQRVEFYFGRSNLSIQLEPFETAVGGSTRLSMMDDHRGQEGSQQKQ